MLTDAEFNELLSEVEKGVEVLAKSEVEMKKDLPSEEEQAPEMSQEPAQEAPAPEMSAEEPSPEMAPEMSQEQPSEEQQPSLDEIYCSMEEPELEEHYEAIKRAMGKMWSQESMDQAPESAPENEMAMSEPEMKKEEPKAEDKKEEKKEESKSDKKDEDKKDEDKKEDSEKIEMKKTIDELESAIEKLTKSIEAKLPSRKSITDAPLAKSEVAPEDLYTQAKELAKNQSLKKSERDVLMDYFINKEPNEAVRKLLEEKRK